MTEIGIKLGFGPTALRRELQRQPPADTEDNECLKASFGAEANEEGFPFRSRLRTKEQTNM